MISHIFYCRVRKQKIHPTISKTCADFMIQRKQNHMFQLLLIGKQRQEKTTTTTTHTVGNYYIGNYTGNVLLLCQYIDE